MAIDISGFVTPESSFEGIYQAGNTLEKQRYRKEQLDADKRGRIAATGKFLTDFLNPKDRLTGTNYDPEIVRQLNEALTEGAELASKGADAASIIMALGPKVGKINEYSQKAKLVNKQITDATAKLKGYKGYNTDAITEEAKKMAFYDENGKLKDISTVDTDKDWVTETVTQRPDLVTTGAGLDEFVSKIPMKEYGSEVQTMYAGKKINRKYDAKAPFYMDVQKDKEGNAITDKSGNPIGLDVVGEDITDDKGNVMLSPEGQPYKALGKAEHDAIMLHNPDIADFIRGRVIDKFKKEANGKVPQEGTEQWNLMSRRLLRDELKTRDRSFFKPRDLETKSAPATRIELGYPAYAPRSSSEGGVSGETGGNAFDDMGDAEYQNFNIKDGAFYNKDGTPKSGKVFISGQYIPSSIKTALNAGGIKPEFLIKGVDAEVKDGQIVSISNELIGTVTRQAMEGVYQRKTDTEPLKGTPLKFADKNAPKTQPKSSSGINWK